MRNLTNKIAVFLACAVLGALVGGCGIGRNKTLFFTKTNVGLDVDSTPPTAEVTISRREGVIAPTFEGGQTPPILASFHLEQKGFAALFAGISSTFVGGDCAVIFAELYDDEYDPALKTDREKARFDSSLELTKIPQPKNKGDRLYGPGDVEPFLFGTDTSFGLKVGWSGMTALAPDTIKLGFNRKEFALAPVMYKSTYPDKPPYNVKMPSFLATVDNSTELSTVSDSEISHLQYFATGKAADKLAFRYAIREAMAKRLDAQSAKGFGNVPEIPLSAEQELIPLTARFRDLDQDDTADKAEIDAFNEEAAKFEGFADFPDFATGEHTVIQVRELRKALETRGIEF